MIEPRIDNAPILEKKRMAKDEKVYYRAKSIAISKTEILNALALVAAILAEPTYVAVLPKVLIPIIAILLPPLNMFLRTRSVRPVAFVMPGKSKPVAVEKLAA